MSEDITYVGDNGAIDLKARVGFSTASEMDDYGNGITEIRSVDFIMPSDIIVPKLGNYIVWNGNKYRLSSKSGSPCWRNADNHGVSIRISTKKDGTA
jgi:hypothetical protein